MRRLAPAVATVALLTFLAVPGTSWAEAIKTSHRAVVSSCAYAAVHGKPGIRLRAIRGCRLALQPASRHGQKRARVAGATWYQNPVSGNTADPQAIQAGSDYYLYATGNLFPIQHSTDLVNWTSVGTAFTQRPSWVVQSGDWNPWSPSVLQTNASCPGTQSTSCYYMYYVGKSAQFGQIHCVGVAIATTPAGPFADQGPLPNSDGTTDSSGRPIGCGDDNGYGNIDPAPFVDSDGKAYLYVSTDYACPSGSASCTLQPTISVISLSPSLLTASGPRTPLFSGDPGTWEQAPWAPVVEGPWMEKRPNGIYYLFYSGGDWTGDYGMGDATMPTPLGPATKDPNNPILFGTDNVYSPGGGSTITGPHGGDWMLYHARLGDYSEPRQLFIDPVIWNSDGTVTINGPTTTPQSPAP